VLLGCHFSCRWPSSCERCGDFGRPSTSLRDEPRDCDGAEHRRNCYAAVDPESALNVVIIETPSGQQMPGLGGAGDALSPRGGDEGTTRELFGLMPGRHKAEGMTRRIGEDTRAVGRRLMAELRGA